VLCCQSTQSWTSIDSGRQITLTKCVTVSLYLLIQYLNASQLITYVRLCFPNASAIYPPQIGWIVTGIFMLISCLASFWLINQHLQWYTNVACLLPHHKAFLTLNLEEGAALCVGFCLIIELKLDPKRRHCADSVYGPDLRGNQLCILPLLGALPTPNSVSPQRQIFRITPHLSCSCGTVMKRLF
jgi:hypothetical protein